MELSELALQNSERSKEDVRANRAIPTAKPQSLYVDLSNRCNLHCVICPYHGRDMRRAEIMPREIFFAVAQELFPTARNVYLFGGGEAFLHPDWDELFDFARQWSFLPIISTNGMPLNARRSEALVRAGTHLRISFDGATRKTFEHIREGARFDTVIRNIERLARCRERLAPAGRFCLRFSVTVYDRNIREAEAIVALAHELGVEEVVFNHLMTDRNALAGHELSRFPELSDEMLCTAAERGAELGVHVAVPQPFDTAAEPARRLAQAAARIPGSRVAPYLDYPLGPDRSYLCRVPWVESWVKPNGNVAPCCMIAQDLRLGSLVEKTFAEVWNGPAYQEFRRAVNSTCPPPTCTPEACELRHHQLAQGRLVPDSGGNLRLTSLCPGRLRAKLVASEHKTDGLGMSAVLTIKNAGDTTWLAEREGESPEGRVRIGAKLLGSDGSVVQQDFLRFPLDDDVSPGDVTVRDIYLEVPRGAAGVLLDLVVEGIAWFESDGSQPLPLMLPRGG